MYVKKAYGYVLPEIEHSCTFKLWKTIWTGWVRWVHQQQGKTHCEVCLKLDGCLFSRNNTPPLPHHPNCHCILEPVDDNEVLAAAETYSDYSKFDPYLIDGVHKGMYGWICLDDCSNGYWPVNFPQCGEKDDIADISIKEEDMINVRVLDAEENERIRAYFDALEQR